MGLGGNQGDVRCAFFKVKKSLLAWPQISSIKTSPSYRSAPWGGGIVDVSEQQDYFNQVLALQTQLPAAKLLEVCQGLENQAGRNRAAARWAARPLDIDILLFGQEQIELPELIIPHPYILQRAFVLKPLFDLDPDLNIPGFGSVLQALNELSSEELASVRLDVV